MSKHHPGSPLIIMQPPPPPISTLLVLASTSIYLMSMMSVSCSATSTSRFE